MEQQAPAAKPNIALLQYKGERERFIDDIADCSANKLEDLGPPHRPIFEQELPLVMV